MRRVSHFGTRQQDFGHILDARLTRQLGEVAAVVEAALRLLVQTKAQAGIRRLRGHVDWDGELEVSRLDRLSPSR